jgi:hypothetical protein
LVISETDNCGMGIEAGEWHWQSTFTVDDQPLDLGRLTMKRAR